MPLVIYCFWIFLTSSILLRSNFNLTTIWHTSPLSTCPITIWYILSTFPSPCLIRLYFFCCLMAWKNLFSRHLIGSLPLFICDCLDMCFSGACFQFLRSLDDDEWWESALWCFQYPHLVLTSPGFPIKLLESGVLMALPNSGSTEGSV